MLVCAYTLTHTYMCIGSLPNTHLHTRVQIAGVNYGGHVTDDWDRRVLYTYIGDMFRDEALDIPYYK